MPQIDLACIDEAIRGGFRLLRFDLVLERHFEHDAADRCKVLIRHNYIGLIVYDLFILGDHLLIPDVIGISVFIHLVVMTPLLFVTNFVLWLRPPVWLREGLSSFAIVLTTAAILAVMLLSHSPLRSSEHLSVVLVILFATMVQRIRFWYVVVACLASFVLYVAALWQLVPFSLERTAISDAVCGGVVLFSLVACYNLEYEQRMGFLLRVRDSLRNRELEAISRRDALTGVGNRRALELALAETRRDATTRSTAVLLCDIDFFKTFNDANGHLAGDDCLRQVAGLIEGALRGPSDMVFRFGGE